MEIDLFYYIFFFIVAAVVIMSRQRSSNQKNLPPSPPSVPIIGHLRLIKGSIHRSLQSLSSQYGPILYLRFGFRSTVVVSSPSAVEECFTKNDVVLANRPRSLIGDRFTYNYTTLVWAPYGQLWRILRRLTVVELFSSASIHKFSAVREGEALSLVRQLMRLSQSAGGSSKVELDLYLSTFTFNIIMMIVTGKKAVSEEDAGRDAGKRILAELRGIFCPSTSLTTMCDFFPCLRWFGYRGVERSFDKLFRARDEFIQGLIDEFRGKRGGRSSDKDVKCEERKRSWIETLLCLQETEPDFYTEDVIKGLVLIMFVAGTETTSRALEWAVSLLLSHPQNMQTLRQEIDKIVGQERILKDMDLPRLPYLRNVISEALRLYPPVPLLLPHYSLEDCTIGGYFIPANTTLIVNAWALQRDPNVWEEPEKFKPERFEKEVGEKEGFKFVCFGIGRRACPGSNVGFRTACLALGTLVQCFDWENVDEDRMEMHYDDRLTAKKANPLKAVCTPRQHTLKLGA